jgi:hypothetical protein
MCRYRRIVVEEVQPWCGLDRINPININKFREDIVNNIMFGLQVEKLLAENESLISRL